MTHRVSAILVVIAANCLTSNVSVQAEMLDPTVSLNDVRYTTQDNQVKGATAAHGFFEGTINGDGEPLIDYLTTGGEAEVRVAGGGTVTINIDKLFNSDTRPTSVYVDDDNDVNTPEVFQGYEVSEGETYDLVVGSTIQNVTWTFKDKYDRPTSDPALIKSADLENTGDIELTEAISGTWVVGIKANNFFGVYAFTELNAIDKFSFDTATFQGNSGADLSNASLFMATANPIPGPGVPEPSSLALLALGVVSMTGLRRRRH